MEGQGMSIALDELVETLDPARQAVTMFGPALELQTVDSICDSGTVLWRAEVTMTHIDSRLDDPDVVVGRIDFVLARTGVDGLADELLDRERFHGLRTDRFAPLFDDYRIGDELAQQFSDCVEVEVVMFVLWVVMDPALREHRLGAGRSARRSTRFRRPVTSLTAEAASFFYAACACRASPALRILRAACSSAGAA